MPRLRFKVHAIIQMEERGLGVEDIEMALANGEDIESRPDELPYPARLVLGLCRVGALHIAVHDNIGADEIIVETAYQPDPVLWEPGFKSRRKR
jgi:D-hexose-6-phosphate mutarotase